LNKILLRIIDWIKHKIDFYKEEHSKILKILLMNMLVLV
jgi:hypothetical protein